MNGQALDLFGAGRYTLETQNIPLIGKALNRATGDKTPFHCEMFDKGGKFTQKNIQCATKNRQTPLQEITYTAKQGLNEYKTKFAIFGFQYVLLEGDVEWSAEDFSAIAVYSDMEETLNFNCSHPLIDHLVRNTRWSAKNNHADVPTDCPTRERHGWTGDAQIFCDTASYFFDYAAFARKYSATCATGREQTECSVR